MINILIVEDSPAKRERVNEAIRDILGQGCEIREAETYVDACRELERLAYDILVLDLLIPRHHGETPEPEWGATLVKRISDKTPRLQRPRYVVGLTAYDEERAEYEPNFADEGWHLLHFEASSDDWVNRLSNILVHAASCAHDHTSSAYGIDIGILTAHSHTELEAVLELPCGWNDFAAEGDDTLYHRGSISASEASLSVVATSAIRMGMPATAALAMKMAIQFRPRFIVMLGIAAGVKGNYGDILIADQSWDYGSGKSIHGFLNTRFEPAPDPIPLDLFLRSRLAMFRTDQTMLREIEECWPGDNKPTNLQAHLGSVASGAAVLENQQQVQSIVAGQRKLIGVEMESYGVFMAADSAPAPKPLACSIKSICDFADNRKSDDFQKLAAYTSAQFFFRFAQRHLG